MCIWKIYTYTYAEDISVCEKYVLDEGKYYEKYEADTQSAEKIYISYKLVIIVIYTDALEDIHSDALYCNV